MICSLSISPTSLVAQIIKNLPAIQETQVQSLGWEDPLQKGNDTHSSIPAWRIPCTEESGGLQSMGSQRDGHNWATNILDFRWLSGKEPACQCRWCMGHRFHLWVRKIPWRKEWQPTQVFLSGEFHAQKSLVGYSPWGCKELDMAEHVHISSLYFWRSFM